MAWREMSYYRELPKTNQQRLREEYVPDYCESDEQDEEIDYFIPKGGD